MPMYFELTRSEIRDALKGMLAGGECQFDKSEKLRVRQIVSELHNYTDMEFETSTKNKQLADKMLVRRIR